MKENSRKIQLRIIKLVNREYLITKTLSYCILMDIWKTKSFSFPPEIGLLPFLLQKTIIIYQTKRNKRIAYTVWLYLVIYIMLIVPKKDLLNEEKCHWMILLLVEIFLSFSFVWRFNFLETLSLKRKIRYLHFALFDRSQDLRYKKCHMGIHVQYK